MLALPTIPYRDLKQPLPQKTIAPTTPAAFSPDSLKTRYVASMLLSAAGDAIAYKWGDWEFNTDTHAIQQEVAEMGGTAGIDVAARTERGYHRVFPISDDTSMHLKTAEALVDPRWNGDIQSLGNLMADKYLDLVNTPEKQNEFMGLRAGGITTIDSLRKILKGTHWQDLPYNPYGIGCGGAMRAMSIGLHFPGEEKRDDLILAAINSGRITHQHPTGFLGALASALLTAYAVEGIPPEEWGKRLLEITKPYTGRAWQLIDERVEGPPETKQAYLSERNWQQFNVNWKVLLNHRNLLPKTGEPAFMIRSGTDTPDTRDAIYQILSAKSSLSAKGWPGASGHDAPLIAYDALLGAINKAHKEDGSIDLSKAWEELLFRGMFHGGDSDSSGVIAGAWFGALYGLGGTPKQHYEGIELESHIRELGEALYNKAHA